MNRITSGYLPHKYKKGKKKFRQRSSLRGEMVMMKHQDNSDPGRATRYSYIVILFFPPILYCFECHINENKGIFQEEMLKLKKKQKTTVVKKRTIV